MDWKKCVLILSLLSLTGCTAQADDIGTISTDEIEAQTPAPNDIEPMPTDTIETQTPALDDSGSKDTVYGDADIDSILAGNLLQVERGFVVDLDGDGEADNVAFKVEPADDYGYRYDYSLCINNLEYQGDTVLLDSIEDTLTLYLLTPDGENIAIAFTVYDNSYNSQTWVHFYDGEQIVSSLLVGTPVQYDGTKGGLLVDALVNQLQWHYCFNQVYQLALYDGEFIFQPLPGYYEYMTYDSESGENKLFQVIKDLNCYADCSVETGSGFIPTGSEFTVTGGDGEEWLLVHINGTDADCWIHVSRGSVIETDGSYTSVQEYIGNIDIVN